MEPKIKSSFIPDKMPQQAAAAAHADTDSASAGADILVVIAIAIFTVSIAFAAGAFLYANYQDTLLETRRAELAREKKILTPATVQFLSRLDQRLRVASEVLAQHTAPTVVFDLLEALTLKSVYYKSFEYTLDPQGNAVISLHGAARSVNGVARQAEVFGESQAIINPIFSNLNITDEGVEFDVKATIDSKALRYVQVVAAEQAASAGGAGIPDVTPATPEVAPTSGAADVQTPAAPSGDVQTQEIPSL